MTARTAQRDVAIDIGNGVQSPEPRRFYVLVSTSLSSLHASSLAG
jgi:hypothetical protein